MMVFLTILKIILLAAGIGYGFGNVIRAVLALTGRSSEISEFQMWAMAIGIAGFVVLQWCI